MRTTTVMWGVILTGALLTNSCGSSSGLRTVEEWQYEGSKRANTDAILYIHNVDVRCRLVSATNDKITISIDGKNKDIPSDVVSRVVFSSSASGRTRTIIGASIGTLVGGVAGYFVGGAASNDKQSLSDIGHPLSILLIAGGAAGGSWIGSWKTGPEEYEITRNVEPYVIDESLGNEITPAEMKMYSLFEGLLDEDNQLLQVQAYKLKNEKYFLLLDVRRYGEYAVDWIVVDEAYLASEKGKIK